MKKEKIKKVLIGVKPLVYKLSKYLIIGIALFSSFTIGGLFEKYKNKENTNKVKKINKSDVSLAIDEGDNLIIIDNKSGDYLIYQDSISKVIFKLYAHKIWKQED